MRDAYLLLTPILVLGVLGLVRFVGCDALLGLDHIDPPPPPPLSFVTGQTLGTARNDFSGLAGMAIQVGSTALKVKTLERYCIVGSTHTHQIQIIDPDTGMNIPDGAVTIDPTGKPEGFVSATVNAGVTLAQTKVYYVVSEETTGGDQFYDNDTTVTVQTNAIVLQPVYRDNTGQWILLGAAGNSYGPVNFSYEMP